MAYKKIMIVNLKNTLLKRQNKRIQKRFERIMKVEEQKGIKRKSKFKKTVVVCKCNNRGNPTKCGKT